MIFCSSVTRVLLLWQVLAAVSVNAAVKAAYAIHSLVHHYQTHPEPPRMSLHRPGSGAAQTHRTRDGLICNLLWSLATVYHRASFPYKEGMNARRIAIDTPGVSQKVSRRMSLGVQTPSIVQCDNPCSM
ncbi:hypothetical protein K461DRAFT_113096 [Myriangium duriaei CBS 260.36]|uniref:Secreted protein n=1 Tax=Myriangium duriaei CBS 260.36 TaxID=1168546 RepID=A0A9P4JAG2_9PEZI|nr:hypothetical protein K461DRAFT_113096 [Myriangium duriaei CBS 260.36]